jgi:serine/threonine protein kinase
MPHPLQRRLSPDGTASGADRVGTPAYMSPEQLRGETLTAASDVWALALLLWEMAAQTKPWAAGATGDADVAERLRMVAAAGAEVALAEEWGYPAGYAEAIRAGTRFLVSSCSSPRPSFSPSADSRVQSYSRSLLVQMKEEGCKGSAGREGSEGEGQQGRGNREGSWERKQPSLAAHRSSTR